ncbi:SEC14-like protein 1 isoform X2 [Folsomia candida]|uniref:SEC14-like protein 1 isoform X2 n=1 Tax=Folsomia candida TaxID=158441 RepID=UPI0016050730|nr:SEC14-like protein 1 isoform X2 [Folsomia candida]
MVQKYQSPVRVYKYSFELVMEAYERRFPTCDMIPVFVGSDILEDTESDDGSQHVVERRCKLNIEAPYLLKKIAGVDLVYFIQKNTLDRKNRSLKIEAFNESFDTRLVVHEVCNYFVHPENASWTCFDQSASLEVKSFFGFEGVVEKIAVKQYSANIAKGKEIIEYFIEELKNEGITSLPVWTPKEITQSQGKVEGGNEATVERDAEDSKANISDEASSSQTIVTARRPSKTRQLSGDKSAGSSVVGGGQPGIPAIRCDSFSEDDDKYRLDADYIQRYLGDLSPLEESQLIQLRTWVAHLQKGKMPSDAILLRFLRAREFNIEKAREMLSQSLTWRKKFQLDKILSEYEAPEVIKNYFPGCWHNWDKDGRPLFVLRLGVMDVKGLMKTVGEEGLLRLTLHICEEGLRLTEEATVQSGYPITTWTLLLDLEGLNMRHLWTPGIKTLLRIIEIVEANYPETMGRVLIIRAPRVFPILWTIVGAFIDERTCLKFVFYGEGPGDFPDSIPEDYIPSFLGGKCKTEIPEGGLVPKTCYMPEEQFLKHLTLSEESIYKCVNLSRGQVHELVIQNDDLGSVITWDFDVLLSKNVHGVCFSIFRTTNSLPAMVPSPTGALQVKPNCPPISENTEHKSVIEKAWKEGHDFFRVESSTVCHDGESVQGSHVTNQTGFYIMQWKFFDPNPTSGHHIMDSLTVPKAKVMYYFEVLKSADYRGSMTSLQSQKSCLSSLSSASKANGSTVEGSSDKSCLSAGLSTCPSR